VFNYNCPNLPTARPDDVVIENSCYDDARTVSIKSPPAIMVEEGIRDIAPSFCEISLPVAYMLLTMLLIIVQLVVR